MAIKILNLISSPFDLGGAERLLLDMADLYDKEQFAVSYCNLFCLPNKESVFNQRLRERNLTDFSIVGNHITNLPQIIARLVAFFRREQFDIVHTHLTHATFIGWLAIRLARRPKFVTSHHYTNDIFQNSDITRSRKISAKLGNYAACQADRVIAVSEAVKNDLVKNGGNSAKIQVIHNGINLEDFYKRLKENDNSFEWESKRVLATVGSLTERKGHHIAVEAMQKISQKFPDAVLLIVGSGELHQPLTDLASRLKLSEKIFFLGFKSNVAHYLKLCDVYVHAALQEPFGIAILEAMAAQKCVVATNVGGIPEIVVDGETGFLVSPSDADLLAETVCRALSNPSKMIQMGQAGQRRVASFDIKNAVSSYQNLYLKLFDSVVDSDLSARNKS